MLWVAPFWLSLTKPVIPLRALPMRGNACDDGGDEVDGSDELESASDRSSGSDGVVMGHSLTVARTAPLAVLHFQVWWCVLVSHAEPVFCSFLKSQFGLCWGHVRIDKDQLCNIRFITTSKISAIR